MRGRRADRSGTSADRASRRPIVRTSPALACRGVRAAATECSDVAGVGSGCGGGAVDRAGQVRQREARGARAGGQDLREHRDGGLAGGRRADVEADRRVQPGQLVVGRPPARPAPRSGGPACVATPSRPRTRPRTAARRGPGRRRTGRRAPSRRRRRERRAQLLREVPDGPVDDDLVGPRVAARRGEHGPGVAHRDAVARRPAPRRPGRRRTRARRRRPCGRGRRDLDEHLDAAVGTLRPRRCRSGPGTGTSVGQRTVERRHEHGRRRRGPRPRARARRPGRARARARAGRRRRSGRRRTRPRR